MTFKEPKPKLIDVFEDRIGNPVVAVKTWVEIEIDPDHKNTRESWKLLKERSQKLLDSYDSYDLGEIESQVLEDFLKRVVNHLELNWPEDKEFFERLFEDYQGIRDVGRGI